LEALTYSTVAVTMGLVVTRPRISPKIRLTPATAALAGVAVLTALGSVRFADIGWAAETMWRPLLGIVSIMTMTGVARRMGVLDGLAEIIFRRASKSGASLFAAVFAFGTLTAAMLNNDSAILLLTPLIVDVARRKRPDLVVPLAFAVFLSAGVAPLVVSNPMNMVVASYSGIGFNDYARAMAVPALAGCIATFAVAYLVFRRELAASAPAAESRAVVAPIRGLRLVTLLALGAVVGAYPIVSYFDGPVWIVAFVGALLLLAIGRVAGEKPREIVKDGVHADTLLFLVAALILSLGLRNAGIVERLSSLYAGASPQKICLVSAAGSALLNNHPK
jgi:arsenical pump membrane protein